MSSLGTTHRPCSRPSQATSTIPIVFATAGDPIGAGVVTRLARPGGNVTGPSSQQPDTASKRLELLREIIPNLHQLAILADAGNPYTTLDRRRDKASQQAPSVSKSPRSISGLARNIGSDVRGPENAGAGAVCPPSSNHVRGNLDRINALATGARLPMMHGVRDYVEGKVLMSYGPNWPDMWRRAADFVARSCVAPSRATFQSSSRPNSISYSPKTAKSLGLKSAHAARPRRRGDRVGAALFAQVAACVRV